MSKKDKSAAGKAGAEKIFIPPVPEILPPVTPVPVGVDSSSLPFPEWSDQELNAEKWDLPKGKDKGKPSPKKSEGSGATEDTHADSLPFVDPHLVQLPHSLSVYAWKRPNEFFSAETFLIYKDSPEYPDLIRGNKHILHSDFIRSFITAINILEYLGNTRPSPIEFVTPTFVPTTADIPWRPWHHIYSMCKAGKGQKHNPQVNTLGKYVVRLYWMGCWRKIVVDDRLPISTTEHLLLPTLELPKVDPATLQLANTISKSKSKMSSGNVKKSKSGSSRSKIALVGQGEVELWPMLLCKALVKLASLSFSKTNELLDFDIIHCLTGWFVQKVDLRGIDSSDIWDMCAAYSDHYTWPDPNDLTGGKKGKIDSKKSSKDTKIAKGVPNFLDGADSGISPYHLVGSFNDMRNVHCDTVPDIAPCWSHNFLIDQTRNVPIIKPDPLPELARWKRFRWLAWAIRKGLWPEPELIPIKCFKMVSVFKQCAEHVVYQDPSKLALDIEKSVAAIEQLALEMGDGKKGAKDKGKEKGSNDAKKSEKSSKGSKGTKSEAILPNPPDPSLWGDYNMLSPYIEYLYIFFKPSQFTTNIRITNMQQGASNLSAKAKSDKGGNKGKGNDGAGETKLVMWGADVELSRNEPIYLFLDGLDSKLIVVNFAHSGAQEALHMPFTYQDVESVDLSFVLTRHSNLISFTSRDITISVPRMYAVIEEYDWKEIQIGEMITFLNTFGNKTLLADVKPGRSVLRLWIKCEDLCTIHLISDSPVVAGNLETVLEYMSREPDQLQKMANDVSSAFGQLVQTFGMPEFPERLKNFYSSYLPYNISKKLKNVVHDCFMANLLNRFKECFVEEDFKQIVCSFRVLFLNPFMCRNQENPIDYPEDSMGDIDENVAVRKKEEQAATVIQALFRRIHIDKLKSQHSPEHRSYMTIFETLKQVYNNVFSIFQRMTVCTSLLRSFLFNNSKMAEIRTYYSLWEDLNCTICLQYFVGNIIVSPEKWIAVTRHVFHVNSPNAILVKICLFCGLSKYMVRVFNNDTKKEIRRYSNNVITQLYENNILGYTVLCYGWTDEISGELPWKLDFVTLKQKDQSLLIIPPVTINNVILTNQYVPNANNLICKCLISIKQDVLVTFRLSVSHKYAKLYFQCRNEVGQIFGDLLGLQNVVVPAVLLQYVAIIDDTASLIEMKEIRSVKSKLRSGSFSKGSTSSSFKRRRDSDRLSTDVLSEKSSETSKKSKSSNSNIVYKDTVYVIEAFVVDDSWPLTTEEWAVVSDVQEKRLFGPPALDAIIGKGGASDLKRNSQTSSTKRTSVEDSRKPSDTENFNPPFWTLEIITNSEEPITAKIDTRREEEIKSIKRKWYQDNPDRYDTSKQLRQYFLEENYIGLESFDMSYSAFDTFCDPTLDSGSQFFTRVSTTAEMNQKALQSQVSDEDTNSSIRSLHKPVSATKCLPGVDLERFFKYESGSEDDSLSRDVTILTAEDEERFQARSLYKMSLFREEHEVYLGDMQKFLGDQVAKNKILDMFYAHCRAESKHLIQNANAERDKVIEYIIQLEMAKQGIVPQDKKDDKAAKGKKK